MGEVKRTQTVLAIQYTGDNLYEVLEWAIKHLPYSQVSLEGDEYYILYEARPNSRKLNVPRGYWIVSSPFGIRSMSDKEFQASFEN